MPMRCALLGLYPRAALAAKGVSKAPAKVPAKAAVRKEFATDREMLTYLVWVSTSTHLPPERPRTSSCFGHAHPSSHRPSDLPVPLHSKLNALAFLVTSCPVPEFLLPLFAPHLRQSIDLWCWPTCRVTPRLFRLTWYLVVWAHRPWVFLLDPWPADL